MTPLLYRVFLIPLTVFFVLFAANSPLMAADTLLVKGVKVDITADSALSARNKAFTEARRLAYQQLAAQYVPASDMANLSIPDDQVLSSMVRDFEIVNEKMTSKRYAGTFDVRFNPAVRGSFSASSGAADIQSAPSVDTGVSAGTVSRTPIITGADEPDDYIYSPARSNVTSVPASAPVATTKIQTSRPTLILPWYGTRARQTLWGQENPWRDAWEASSELARDKSMPFLLPVGDADDMRDYAPSQALSGAGDIEALMRRYRATDAVLAIAEPAEGGALIVSLYRLGDGTPVAMGRFGVDGGSGDETLKQAVDRAVVSLRAMPQVNLTQPASVSTQAGSISIPATMQPFPTTPNAMYFVALARFSGLQQWVGMRNALSTTPGIQGVDVQSISPSQAQVQFAYSGDHGSLAALLAQKGLQIAPLGTGVVPSVPGAMVPQYQLSAIRSY